MPEPTGNPKTAMRIAGLFLALWLPVGVLLGQQTKNESAAAEISQIDDEIESIKKEIPDLEKRLVELRKESKKRAAERPKDEIPVCGDSSDVLAELIKLQYERIDNLQRVKKEIAEISGSSTTSQPPAITTKPK